MGDILVVFIRSQNERNEQIDTDIKSEKATVKLAMCFFNVLRRDRR